MMTGILIALAAGVTSALMFASVVSGTLVSVMLMYLAPLPLLVATLGWAPMTAAIGAGIAVLALSGFVGFAYALAFAMWAAIPALWLGHLMLLGRATGTQDVSGKPVLEWYPLGQLLLWIATFAAIITMGTLLTLGSDAETIQASLRRGLTRMFGDRIGGEDARTLSGAMMMIAPAAGTLGTMIALTLNVWLAAKIARISGRLHRPWPDIKSTTLPPMTLAALFAAIAFCFVGGLASIAAQVVSAALMTAYALTGLATLHTVTLALKSRVPVLSFAYVSVLVFGWPVILMSVIGLSDQMFGLRRRYHQRHHASPTV